RGREGRRGDHPPPRRGAGRHDHRGRPRRARAGGAARGGRRAEEGGGRMSAMFRSFRTYNYRTWFIGAVISNIGGWMQATAQDWVVLTELTNNDAAAMGATMALQFGPPLVLVNVTGWVADRFDRRKILLTTQSTLMVLAVGVAVLLLTGVMTLPLMFCFAAAFGV